MAVTTSSSPSRPAEAARPAAPRRARTTEDRRTARHGRLLVLALLAACAYAAFAHGAVAQPAEPRLQIALAAVAGWAAAAWLMDGTLRWRTLPAGRWGIGLLVAFAAWSALTVLWSVAPDRTWLEANRALSYALVVALAIAAGASDPRAIERVAAGFVWIAAAVALYALGGKVLPGLHVHPFFDLDHTADVARLRAPLEYWNALALVCVLAVPAAMRLATEAARRPRTRLAALAALLSFMLVLGLSYSRGGVLALVVAVVTMTALGGARLRGLLVLALAALAAAPALAVAFSSDALTANGAPLAQRIDDGRLLLAVIAGCLAVLLAAGALLVRLESRVRWSARRSRVVWRALAVGALLLAVAGVAALAQSDRGLRGSITHGWDSFTEVRADRQFDPVRLVSANSGNRWVWWQEAAGAWSDRPVGGWGAGSFPVTHKLYRDDDVPVSQPHSVPLQFLAETGAVGFALGLGGLIALAVAGLARLRRLPPGRARDLGVALFAAAVAWLAHGLYDWDWDIPGVTLPALLFLGVLAARPRTPGAAPKPFGELDREGVAGRALALAGVTLLLAGAAAGAALPALSDAAASDAQALVGNDATPAELERAAARAELAARLDPLAVRPLMVASDIAIGRGRLLDARRYLLQAARRQPDSADVWFRLTALALQLADRQGVVEASRRLVELDPAGGAARSLATHAQGLLARPSESATAAGTPLPAPGG